MNGEKRGESTISFQGGLFYNSSSNSEAVSEKDLREHANMKLSKCQVHRQLSQRESERNTRKRERRREREGGECKQESE